MENKTTIIDLKEVTLRQPDLQFRSSLNWSLGKGEQWAVIGPNGAGKTIFSDLLQGRLPVKSGQVSYHFEGKVFDRVKSIAFKDIYSLTDCRNSYYQQRWHSTETEEVKTVAGFLSGKGAEEEKRELLAFFGIEELLPKRIIFLSSGELRKFLIVKVLLTRPKVLILDNPFIGLDASSRVLLAGMLTQITRLRETQVVLLLSDPADIPEMITHVLPIKKREIYPVETREQFQSNDVLKAELFPQSTAIPALPPAENHPSTHTCTFRMENVSIRYGERTILKELNWEVRNGEKWALFGPNGSGKSTLLSLVYADNPQSYANTLYLFDRKRGSGESIWEIKKRIGYVSPEMHLYYMENVPTIQIVGSGFFDSIGLYRKCDAGQERIALEWMRVFGIDSLKGRLFLSLSSGEQRLALLARLFVKDPDLVVLDEPLHGLDIANKGKVIAIIEQFCTRPGKTLIYVTHYPGELPACIDRRFELTKNK